MKENHIRPSGKKRWQMRVTIDQGPKFVGKRITLPIEADDKKGAELVARSVFRALSLGGFISKIAQSRANNNQTINNG